MFPSPPCGSFAVDCGGLRFNKIMDLHHITAKVRLNMRLILSCTNSSFSHTRPSSGCSVSCPNDLVCPLWSTVSCCPSAVHRSSCARRGSPIIPGGCSSDDTRNIALSAPWHGLPDRTTTGESPGVRALEDVSPFAPVRLQAQTTWAESRRLMIPGISDTGSLGAPSRGSLR